MGRSDSRDTLREIIVRQYLREARSWASPSWRWGTGAINELLNEPRIAWPLLLEIIARTPDNVLGAVAAGPLEDFLAAHGNRVLTKVTEEAERDPKFRRALAGVWQNRMSDATWASIQALVGDDDRHRFEGEEPPWQDRLLIVEIDGLPPMHAAGTDADSIDRRGRLLDAVLGAKRDGPEPWTSPVRLDLVVSTVELPSATTMEILAAVVETVAADRPQRLVAPRFAGRGPIASASLVRSIEARDARATSDSYRLELFRIMDDELAVMDTPMGPEELLATLEAELAAESLDGLDGEEWLLRDLDGEQVPPGV